MSSLRALLAHASPALLIDSASPRIQVALLARDEAPRSASTEGEAGMGIFSAVASLGLELSTLRAFVYCEGPGSVLGIRTAAMALRTWSILEPRPIFSYQSLALLAAAEQRPEVTYIADARRQAWHAFRAGGTLQRVASGELGGELATPDNFRNWAELPAGTRRVSYSVADILPRVMDADLFSESIYPDAFLHEDPAYATWTPRVHQAR